MNSAIYAVIIPNMDLKRAMFLHLCLHYNVIMLHIHCNHMVHSKKKGPVGFNKPLNPYMVLY